MRTRFSFALLVTFLAAVLVIGLLPSIPPEQFSDRAASTPGVAALPSATAQPFAGHAAPARTLTVVPAPSTHTPAPTEKLNLLPSETLIAFPIGTSTRFEGTPTAAVPSVFANGSSADSCATGPGPGYAPAASFRSAEIVGRDQPGNWWFLKVDQGGAHYIFCWVAGKQVSTGGDLSRVVVSEAAQAGITQVRIDTPAAVQTVSCAAGAPAVAFHVTGQITTDGPIENISYVWETDAPLQLHQGQVRVNAWNEPAGVELDFSLPAHAALYFLRLHTTLPMEAVAVLSFEVKCKI